MDFSSYLYIFYPILGLPSIDAYEEHPYTAYEKYCKQNDDADFFH